MPKKIVNEMERKTQHVISITNEDKINAIKLNLPVSTIWLNGMTNILWCLSNGLEPTPTVMISQIKKLTQKIEELISIKNG